MKIKGLVTSGSQKGMYFMSQEVYSSQFKEILGFAPFKGTLNILIDEKNLENLQPVKEQQTVMINGSDKFGDVLLLKARLEDKIEGAVIFPVKTHHPEEFLEFIAQDNLRKTLHLRDGDEVSLIF
ncbi:MAG: CTP-dependent riboflavin kinase [Euryarchaeota archaeon]|nr:CTP-dependent riboflavin kinase [Euryarchaeota archaeon]MBU4547503.1 CTP-dependent riboflavin kinase [Euryarchaeota archaeon]MBU4607213.1 CTP-dependent riboflavin kinase [Euryarchaeota archaeon]MBV1755254.1 CTP-dependent riboflavin kinase [Methanobacterium sp.]MBV1766693.1 CTP-dependent riboflavin kinase [Methanobacterium sp.]